MEPEEFDALMADENNGSWHDAGDLRVYTPNPSMFAKITPHELLNAFLDMSEDDKVALNLP